MKLIVWDSQPGNTAHRHAKLLELCSHRRPSCGSLEVLLRRVFVSSKLVDDVQLDPRRATSALVRLVENEAPEEGLDVPRRRVTFAGFRTLLDVQMGADP